MGTFLVVGGSRGYGCQIAFTLQGTKHKVYTLQRTPPPDGIWGEMWFEQDLEDFAKTALTVHAFVSDEVVLDGVVFAAAANEKRDHRVLNAFDLRDHLETNVIAPTLMLRYLGEHGVLKPNGVAIFLLDDRELEPDRLPYMVSKAAIRPVVDTFFRSFHHQIRIVYVCPPPSTVPGSEDIVTETIRKVLTGETEILGNLIDLR